MIVRVVLSLISLSPVDFLQGLPGIEVTLSRISIASLSSGLILGSCLFVAGVDWISGIFGAASSSVFVQPPDFISGN